MVNSYTKALFPDYQFRIALADNEVVNAAANAGFGALNASVFYLSATSSDGADVSGFDSTNVLVKLPYTGLETDVDKINLITSADGKTWSAVGAANILLLNPRTDSEDGYLVFSTSHFSYYGITAADETNTSVADSETSSGGSGGGGSLSPWLLVLLAGFYSRRFRNKK